MQILTAIFSWLSNAGASVMMPIILTILGMVMGAKFGEALRAGLTFGVGFIGLNAVIGIMASTVSVLGQDLVNNLNFKLTTFDVGWPAGAAIAWSTEVVPWVFIVVIITNIIMIATGLTKTMDVDIWNYWHVLFIASAIVLVCGEANPVLAWVFALGQAALCMAIIFLVADWVQADCAEVFGLEGISLPHIQSINGCIITYPVDKLIGMIPGLKDINIDLTTISDKLGLLGEPLMIGLIIGMLLQALASFTTPDKPFMTSIQEMLKTGMNISAVMILIPRMVALLMEGLMPISEFTQEFLEKRFPGKELYIGLDAAVATGHPFVVTLALIAIPIIYIEAVLLPYNTVLPLTDLSALVFYVECCVLPNHGNLFRGLLLTILMCCVYLFCSSYAGPVMTGLASYTGMQIPEGGTAITCIAVGSQFITWIPFAIAKMICL